MSHWFPYRAAVAIHNLSFK